MKNLKSKSVRNYAYAALLTISAFSFSPSIATAEDAGGNFTLPHAVRWQNVVIPAGNYRFALQSMGPSQMLTLSRVDSATPASFMLLAQETEEIAGTAPSRLVLGSKSGVSYVSEMDLPEFALALHFSPPPSTGKEIALAGPVSAH